MHEKEAGGTCSPAAVVLIYAELVERLGIGREAAALGGAAGRRRYPPASGSRPRNRLRLASATDACLSSASVACGYTPTSTAQKQMCQPAAEASFGTHGHAAQGFGRLEWFANSVNDATRASKPRS